MSDDGAYHSGEIAVQERTGDRSLARRRGSMITDRLADGVSGFLRRQGVAAVAAAAPDGSLWTSLWCGAAGFVRADARGERVHVVADLDRTLAGDVVHPIVRAGAPLAMVVIDFATRQRLRINGIVNRVDAAGIELRVRETFGNCLKYIQQRQRVETVSNGPVAGVEQGRSLDDARRAFVARTDTLFVASIHPERGLDVSHRGGEPGFVRVTDDSTLRIPDYPGNAMYQTLGNFEVDSRAGLALIDFERRRVLSLTGHAIATFGADDPRHPTGGTNRYWSFTVDRWAEVSLPPTMTWTLVDRSRFNPPAAA